MPLQKPTLHHLHVVLGAHPQTLCLQLMIARSSSASRSCSSCSIPPIARFMRSGPAT